ncbi:hypothetical protein C8R46DRAFT_1352718 [Mycena filopes]|nr:hypothetical protein C8R46DRAFT_1352718 [Mycena filopes]
MHKLLRLEKLSSLPFSSRRIAQSAAKGSLPDLIRLMALFCSTTDMATFAGCLPVLYVNLDPAGIPTGGNLFTRPVQRACIALKGFRHVHGSYDGAGIDLWRRIWPWLTFLNTHRDLLPEIYVSQMNFDPLFFIFCLGDDEETTSFIHQSPGLYSFVADRWISLLEAKGDDELRVQKFAYLANCLDLMDAHDTPANLLELVDATNGPHRFASLVVRTLSLFIPDQGTRMTTDVVHFYKVFASFLLEVAMADCVEGTSRVDILSALVSAGTIRLVTNMIRAIGESSGSEELADHLLDAFELLDRLLRQGSYKGIAEALAAGLLPAIIRASIIVCRDTDDFTGTALYGIMVIMLPGALVYHTVVAPLEPQLIEAEPLASDPDFKASPMYKSWRYFTQVGWDRIHLLEEVEEGDWRREWACNNIACGAMQDKSDFRRCSNCQRAYYCSSACQRQDWRDGGHRDVCRQLRISMFKNSDLGSRNVSFMRAILERNTFPNEDEEMVRAHLALARSHPNQLTIHVRDSKFGDPCDELRLLDDVRLEDDRTDEDVCWDAYIARAARSGGLITLHLMLFWDGERTRRWLFTTRRENPTLQRGLARILEEVTPHGDSKDAVEKLVDELDFEYDTHSTFQ